MSPVLRLFSLQNQFPEVGSVFPVFIVARPDDGAHFAVFIGVVDLAVEGNRSGFFQSESAPGNFQTELIVRAGIIEFPLNLF